MVYLTEAGAFGVFGIGKYSEILEPLLRRAYGEFLQYKRDNKLDASHPRFTPARLNRTVRASFASLSSKAAASKCITFWLIAKLRSWSERADATDRDRQVALCFWSYGEILRIMDESPMILPDSVAEEFFQRGMQHLRLYSALRLKSSRTLGASAPMRYLFLLLPKHHHLQHLLFEVRSSKINPKSCTLLCAESFIGLFGRVARSCHRSSVSKRSLERYLLMLGFHVKDVRATSG